MLCMNYFQMTDQSEMIAFYHMKVESMKRRNVFNFLSDSQIDESIL